MAFMEQRIDEDSAYEVETEEGTEIVPRHVCGDLRIRGEYDEDSTRWGDLCSAVGDYVGGRRIRSIRALPKGWVCRMSAPGYLDCTSWEWHPTKREAQRSLRDKYGDE